MPRHRYEDPYASGNENVRRNRERVFAERDAIMAGRGARQRIRDMQRQGIRGSEARAMAWQELRADMNATGQGATSRGGFGPGMHPGMTMGRGSRGGAGGMSMGRGGPPGFGMGSQHPSQAAGPNNPFGFGGGPSQQQFGGPGPSQQQNRFSQGPPPFGGPGQSHPRSQRHPTGRGAGNPFHGSQRGNPLSGWGQHNFAAPPPRGSVRASRLGQATDYGTGQASRGSRR